MPSNGEPVSKCSEDEPRVMTLLGNGASQQVVTDITVDVHVDVTVDVHADVTNDLRVPN